MKTARTILVVLLVLVGIYLVAYWLLIKRDWVNYVPSKDPFNSSGPRQVIEDLFGPLREIDFQLNHDPVLRQQSVGHWVGEAGDDFVTITSSLECRFQLGEFRYEGGLKYGRAYGGLFTEFVQDGRQFIFILSPNLSAELSALPKPRVTAFIGHDPAPRVRETDYMAELVKRAQP